MRPLDTPELGTQRFALKPYLMPTLVTKSRTVSAEVLHLFGLEGPLERSVFRTRTKTVKALGNFAYVGLPEPVQFKEKAR